MKEVTETQINRDGSEVTLVVTIPAKQVKEAFARSKAEALKGVKVHGFRPGKAPKEIAEKHLDEDALAQSLFQELVPPAYAQAVSKEGLKPVIPPEVTVKSFQKDEKLVFEAKTAERPPVDLGDYLKALRSLKGEVIYGPEGKPLKGEVTAAQVLDKLREAVKINIPHVLIDYEVKRMLSSLIDQVRSLGITVDQYLSSQGKTAEGVRKEYHETAERNLRDEFILSEVAEAEDIKVSEGEIEEAIEATPDEKAKSFLKEERGRSYLEDTLRRRKTIERLLTVSKK
ncbi:MAG: hypothetical protein BMS9Abin34_399 [Patescibacteria group bacterium]|nr:MAG: hypothetical protein BMS9Abin34_399 [Patescibacteria group bacterium]